MIWCYFEAKILEDEYYMLWERFQHLDKELEETKQLNLDYITRVASLRMLGWFLP